MDLIYFNPRSQSEADFIASFVARHEEFDYFIRQLRLHQSSRHHLIVAPRGFGKSSLLRRVAIAVRDDEDLREHYIALSFREEQHNVISLDVFWRNCLQSLLETREDEDAAETEIEQIDSAWEELAPRQALPQAEQDGSPAMREFLGRCEALNRRPLLLVDNLDLLLDGLSAPHQWLLRKALQVEHGPIMLAASSRYPDSTRDREAPFYDFFRIQSLDRLNNEEVMQCLRELARHRGKAGVPVLELLEREPGRVAALNTMAGGNPRTLSVLYGVLESHMSADVSSQLSSMLDQFTGWYQSRTEDLPAQGRAVFDALALNWDPLTAAGIGRITGLGTTSVSSQLSRLERTGYVETVPLSSKRRGRNGYQLIERFYNIWYLMRNGPRRARQAIKFLTVFLQSCFSSSERRSMAHRVLRHKEVDLGYTVALASTIDDGLLSEKLLGLVERHCDTVGKTGEYDSIIRETRFSLAQGGGDAMGLSTPPTPDELAALDETISRLLGSTGPSEMKQLVSALQSKGFHLVRSEQLDVALGVFETVVSRFGGATGVGPREWAAKALFIQGLLLGQLGRPEEGIEAYEQVIDRFGDASEVVLRRQVEKALFYKGRVLGQIGRRDAVLATLRSAIELDVVDVDIWSSWGNLLLDLVGNPKEALVAFKRGLSLASKGSLLAFLHSNCAFALALHGEDREEVRDHVRAALDLSGLSEAGRMLLAVLLELGGDSEAPDWIRVFESLHGAIESGDEKLWTIYFDDLMRLLWFILAQGEGPRLLAWMKQNKYPMHQAPLYHAVVAAVEGEDHLLRINPETREPARPIYEDLSRRLRLYDNGTRADHPAL